MGNIEYAEFTGNVIDNIHGYTEDEELVYFHLQDSVHEFMIGLGDLLDCLKFVEREGFIPPIAKEWWWQLAALYPDRYDSGSWGMEP